MSASDDVKLSLRLFKLILIIVIFIHLTTCMFFFIVKEEQLWVPPQFTTYGVEESLYDLGNFEQYVTVLYNGMLWTTGNDVQPADTS